MVTSTRATDNNSASLEELIDRATREFKEKHCDEIKIDCSSVTTVKSHMLDRLIRLYLDARRHQMSVILENVNEMLFDVLTITRLDRTITIRRDEAQTLHSMHRRK